MSVSAGSITVSQTLALLDSEHATFAEGVADALHYRALDGLGDLP